MDNCCDSMLNKLVAIFNFFLFLIGAILIGVGTYIHVQVNRKKCLLSWLTLKQLGASNWLILPWITRSKWNKNH